MILIFIGPPGSGKGTQAQVLSKKLNLPHVSTGDILRNAVDSDDEDNKLVQKLMSEGKLVDDNLVNKIVKKFLSKDEYKNGCILDGYPRNLEQGKFLETVTKNIVVIYFNVSEDVTIKRILGRFSCAQCGKIYNSYYSKPKEDNKCDICGSDKFIYRTDDNKESIMQRLKVYKAETFPLIDYYSKQKYLYTINTDRDIKETEKEMLDICTKASYTKLQN